MGTIMVGDGFLIMAQTPPDGLPAWYGIHLEEDAAWFRRVWYAPIEDEI
jgi:hypothetical protein